MNAIEVDDVTLRYRRDAAPAVSGVSLSVPDGGALGIVGESGSGKSTLARMIVGEREPSEGAVRVFGQTWREIPARGPVRRSVQMVFQDPYGALNPRLTPVAAVAEAVGVAQGVARGRREAVARELLAEVGLSGAPTERLPARLSGGQRQRVVIARALACEPKVLVADEPTSALDVSVQAQILNLLMRLREERALTLVLISHDITVVDHMTDRIAVMLRGEVVEHGATETVLRAPEHEYTKQLIAAFYAGAS
jgi:ABC-type glutathione transport system ATPase component